MSLAAFTTHRPAGATYGRDEGAALAAALKAKLAAADARAPTMAALDLAKSAKQLEILRDVERAAATKRLALESMFAPPPNAPKNERRPAPSPPKKRVRA